MIESDSMPTIGHWALRIPTSSISKGNHIGFEACDNSEQGKMPRWGREKMWKGPLGAQCAVFECCQQMPGRGNKQSGNFLLLRSRSGLYHSAQLLWPKICGSLRLPKDVTTLSPDFEKDMRGKLKNFNLDRFQAESHEWTGITVNSEQQ